MVHIQKGEKAKLMPQMNIGIYQLAIPVSASDDLFTHYLIK